MLDVDKQIDLVAAAARLSDSERARIDRQVNGGIFLSHTTPDSQFIRSHIEPKVVAEFYGAVFFQNQSFPMSWAYEPYVGQALLSCKVVLVAVSRASLASRYMAAELRVADSRSMPTIVCRLDDTAPTDLHPSLRRRLLRWRSRTIAVVDFADPKRGIEVLGRLLTSRAFSCAHSIAA